MCDSSKCTFFCVCVWKTENSKGSHNGDISWQAEENVFVSSISYDILSVTFFPIWQMRRLTQTGCDYPQVPQMSQGRKE